MGTILICLICGVIFSIRQRKKHGKVWCDGFDIAGYMSCSFIISLILILTLSLLATVLCESEEVIESSKELIALKDNSTIDGTFFLGSGSINGEMKYVAMVKDKNGYKMETYRIEDVYINEVDNNFRIEEIGYEFKNENMYLFFGNIKNHTYRVYIPKDSVVQNYKIDLE